MAADSPLIPADTRLQSGFDSSGNKQSSLVELNEGTADSLSINSADSSKDQQHLMKADTAVSLDKITVSAAPLRVYHPSFRSIASEEFKGRYPDLPSVLEGVSGVAVQRAGGIGGYTVTTIRGGSAQQMGVYLDDVPLNTASGGAVDLGKIPVNSLSSIEVYKGPVPMDYSDKSMSGCILLKTEPDKDFTSADIEAGSFGYLRGGTILRKSISRVTQYLVFDNTVAENNYPYFFDKTRYDNSDGVLLHEQNNDYSSFAAIYSSKIQISPNHKIQATVSANHTNQGIFLYLLSDQVLYPRLENRIYSFTGKYSGLLLPQFSMDVSANGRYSSIHITDPQSQLGLGGSKTSNEETPYYQATINLGYTFSPAFSLRGIGRGSYERWKYDNDVNGNGADRRIAAEGGIELEAGKPDLVQCKAQYIQVYENDSTDIKDQQGDLGVSQKHTSVYLPLEEIEVRFHQSDMVSLYASQRYSGRSPTFYEKYGLGSSYKGNPDLKPEKKIEIDIGAGLVLRTMSATVSGFGGKTYDKIRVISQSQMSFIPVNYAEIYHAGIECEIEIHPAPWIRISNSMTLMQNRFGASLEKAIQGNKVPYEPDFKNAMVLVGNWKGFEVEHRFCYASPYHYDSYNGDTSVTGKPVLDLAASYRFKNYIVCRLRIDNYLDYINYDFRYSPRSGRAYYAGVTFNFK